MSRVTRRTALQLLAATAVGGASTAAIAQKDAAKAKPEAAKKAEGQFTDAKSIADFYNRVVQGKLNELRQLSGDVLAEPMDFFVMMKMPRVQFIAMANNHSIHHRGQLAAYLRAMGSKVPNIYGPSADAEPAA